MRQTENNGCTLCETQISSSLSSVLILLSSLTTDYKLPTTNYQLLASITMRQTVNKGFTLCETQISSSLSSVLILLSSLTTYYPLPTTYYPLPTTYYPLPTTDYRLPTKKLPTKLLLSTSSSHLPTFLFQKRCLLQLCHPKTQRLSIS